jgi:malonyl-CoA decarboxylase
MSAADWLSRNVSRFTASDKAGAALRNGRPKKKAGTAALPARSTHERLQATLSQKDEALSPRVLRRTLQELQAIIDPRVSEVEGGRRAMAIAAWYEGATPARRRDLWMLMSEQFVANPQKVKAAQAQFAAAVGTPEEAVAEVRYRRATVSPRRRLLQRFSVYPGGIQFLVDMRADMQPSLKADKRLLALDVEMEYMFSTWFDVGFLDLRRITWDSPASLIEKLIKYEAVHDIKGWADVKNRLDSDRRCYGFFHPRLPEVPLIFVEVAMVERIAGDIMPLLDELAAPSDLSRATTAIFYSISNTQAGLRGVSFGDSLIKRVVESLKDEFPKLKTFATLSPIPGFRSWLGKNAAAMLEKLGEKGAHRAGPGCRLRAAGRRAFALGGRGPAVARRKIAGAKNAAAMRRPLPGADPGRGQAAGPGGALSPGQRRARRAHQLGRRPDAQGLKQSYGLMVNYLYDLKRLDRHRAQLAQGEIPVSGDIEDLYI